MQARSSRPAIVALVGVVAFALSFIVCWTMRFRYEHSEMMGQSVLVRIDRLKGTTDILAGEEWWRVQEPSETPTASDTAAKNSLDVFVSPRTDENRAPSDADSVRSLRTDTAGDPFGAMIHPKRRAIP